MHPRVVRLPSRVQFSATSWTAACQASLFISNSRSLLKLMYIESVMLSNHLNLCHPLLLLPSIFSSIRVFSSESALRIRWPKYWSFSISPSSEFSGLISFRIDWFDLLAVRRTLKSKTLDTDLLIPPETRSLKSKCQQSWFLLRGHEDRIFCRLLSFV